MAETLRSIVKEAKKNKLSLSKKLSEDDIVAIWERAADFIEKQMLQQKGVAVSGLGVFTFSQRKIEVGSKVILIQRPIFVLSEKLIQIHSLHFVRQHTTGQIPVVPLNFTHISSDSPFSRDAVEMSLKDVLLAMSRLLAEGNSIQLDVGKIGRLLIGDGKVKMRFFRNFIGSLSGGVERAFRPNTANSVLSIMSNPSPTRPAITTPVLPKIVEPSGEDDELHLGSPRPLTDSSSAPGKLNDCVIGPEDSVSQRGGRKESVGKLASISGRRSLIHAPSTIFSTTDHPLTSSTSQEPSTKVQSSPTESTTSKKKHKAKQTETSRPSTCSHPSPVDMDLCYICFQRAKRNVAMDLSKQRREREKLDDKMLHDYREQQDLIALAKELTARSNDKVYNRRIASLNLEIAHSLQEKRMAKPDFHPSYIFCQRESTPAKYLKQTEYCGQLDSQVSYKHNKQQRLKQLEEKLSKEEQIKLAEELAKDQKNFNERKFEKMVQYQRALAEQTRQKAIKREHMIQPQFVVHEEFCSDKRSKQKEMSKKLLTEQLKMANDKRELAKRKAELEKLEESEILKQTRKGLIEDLRADKHQKLSLRKDLEWSWGAHVSVKQQQELEEIAHSEKPSILVQQQCDKYLRCDQCQKSRSNLGKSNVLAETRYLSGSRLMD